MSGKDPSLPKGYSYHLFVLPSDPEKEKWDGLPIGIEGAMKSYKADQVHPFMIQLKQATSNTRISSELPSLLSDAKHIYITFPTVSGSISDEIRPRPRFLTNVSRYLPFLNLDERYKSLTPLLHEFRSIKSVSEISCIREAGRISGKAFNEVIRRAQTKEKDIEATLEWLFRLGGCERAAYVPVVAGGKVHPLGQN
jgi:intermediate cleaving peptidase 55